ncbi:MAG: xanthine dehydrogenase family protein molybdopterin-binding subunit, partial [Candidatus Limnocylindria bacterium]
MEYEALPAVLAPADALADGAPVLHPDAASYRFLRGDRPSFPHPNHQGYAVHEHGDLAEGFARAAHVFEHTFRTARTHQAY